jgi:hypothetical protein
MLRKQNFTQMPKLQEFDSGYAFQYQAMQQMIKISSQEQSDE